MPEIARFYGIIVALYYSDHSPPHFHARYRQREAVIEIATLQVREGSLAHRAQAMVLEWAATHHAELLEDWELARRGEPLRKIAPLE